MQLRLRPAELEDLEACGRICFEAFTAISEAHNFPPDFPSPELATGLLTWMVEHPDFYGVVAEEDGRIVGSNFLDLRNSVAGLGPITVDPSVQNRTVGRHLMEDAHQQAAKAGATSVRLVQAAFNARSLSLYAKLGYDVCEPLACLQGPPLNQTVPGKTVRPAVEADLDACNRVCRAVHGYDRGRELQDALAQGTASVVESDGRLIGYATLIGFMGHAVGKENADVQALIGAAGEIAGPGLLLPMRNTDLLRWCLAQGLRITQPLTLMCLGPYPDPAGAFLPTILQ